MFDSGFGDGSYFSYVGFDSEGWMMRGFLGGGFDWSGDVIGGGGDCFEGNSFPLGGNWLKSATFRATPAKMFRRWLFTRALKILSALTPAAKAFYS